MGGGSVRIRDGGREGLVAVVDFDDFYRAEFAPLVSLAGMVLGQRAGAEDVAQEGMVDAYRRWDRLSTYDSPRAWVRKVVVQRAVKVARKRSNERVAQLRSVPPSAEGTPIEPFDPELLTHLRELPPQQRAALALHYLDDASVLDIAQTLGVSEGTVKTHLHKGRQRLAASLGPSAQGEEEVG